jgi:GNAT superfamily N-acetyltransferase
MITLLEMHDRPTLSYTRPRRSGMLLALDEPSVEFYRYLHERAGTPRSRRTIDSMSDEDLFGRLTDPAIEVFVLFLGGAPAGFFELDRRTESETELVHVGLDDQFRGRGLGKYLVATAVETAWDHDPTRVWASANEDDDPRGLLLYQWAGFDPFETLSDD